MAMKFEEDEYVECHSIKASPHRARPAGAGRPSSKAIVDQSALAVATAISQRSIGSWIQQQMFAKDHPATRLVVGGVWQVPPEKRPKDWQTKFVGVKEPGDSQLTTAKTVD